MNKWMFVALCFAAQASFAQNIATQDPSSIRTAAEDFLRQQSAGQPSKITVNVGQIDNRLNLSSCTELSPFLPQGSKPWGKIIVGVRCNAPTPWVVYINANVQVSGEYYVTANAIAQGQVITASDITKVTGELSSLPPSVITSPTQAIGKTLNASISAGTVLRADALKNTPVVQQGQSVRVISKGTGFQVATDGQSLSNASEGQVARAKTTSGQVVSGIAKLGGIIEVTF